MRTCTGVGPVWRVRRPDRSSGPGSRIVDEPMLSDVPDPLDLSDLLRGGLALVCQEALNLLHGVVDLDVEGLLAERGARAARVASDAVVLARRRVRIAVAAAAARAGRRHRIAFGGRNQILAHPALI